MPTSVYNPRDNTFIKAPESKTCPTCGQIVMETPKPMTNHMNNYISDKGVIMTINSNEDTIDIKGVTMYRCDEAHPTTGLVHVSSLLRAKLQSAQLQQQQGQFKLQAAQQQAVQTNP